MAALVAAHPQGVNHEIETRDVDATQTPRDIAIGRGHTAFCDDLTVYFPSTAAATSSSASGASCGQPTTGGAAGGAEASQSAVSSSSSSMKAPISADGQLCNICYCTDHADGSVGVACDNNHFLCSECFTSYVESESDTVRERKRERESDYPPPVSLVTFYFTSIVSYDGYIGQREWLFSSSHLMCLLLTTYHRCLHDSCGVLRSYCSETGEPPWSRDTARRAHLMRSGLGGRCELRQLRVCQQTHRHGCA